MKVGTFGQLFLGEVSTATGQADVFPDGFADRLNSGHASTQAGTESPLHSLTALVCLRE